MSGTTGRAVRTAPVVDPGPDPRPQLSVDSATPKIIGWVCTQCGHPLALSAPWCPICRGELTDALWGPGGQVWSSTVLRVPLPGRTPPMVLVYVDLDDGPRVLGHVDAADVQRLHAGTRVSLTGASSEGDLLFVSE
ncbi:OB-fold domain-containing protein [Rhodococcus ruber]|uniref:OB-fold domain-containing protein n=1 Tax=Rhodococcus ruber TaxID=1830 RepID=A0ABT4MI93_9NOCA|nr:OB-fold domain-containing protein [Rhodococcus ruber]MCZ4519451.1 OB-fold domain-containing protein [Rhodococcus ruber]